MSAQRKRAEWERYEALYSRPEYVWPLAEYFRRRCPDALQDGDAWVEPCVGAGDLITGVALYMPWNLEGYYGDVRPVQIADWHADWTGDDLPVTSEWWPGARAALVLTNPPFSRAMAIVEASWRHCPGATVAILQRATWYEPTKKDPRGPWLRKHNPDQITIGRCQFFWPDGTSRGDGDSCSYTWYVWGPDRQGPLGGHHEIIPWQEAPKP